MRECAYAPTGTGACFKLKAKPLLLGSDVLALGTSWVDLVVSGVGEMVDDWWWTLTFATIIFYTWIYMSCYN